MPNKLTQDEFIKRARDVHGDKYSYDKVVYTGALKKVIITCPVHGDFTIRPSEHLKGRGCNKCYWLKQKVNSVGGVCDIVSHNKIDKKAYDLWYSMLSRCKISKSYINCSVCDEWMIYSNFKKWFDKNYIEGYAMDKDLFSNGNKLYSPDTCCFIPVRLNSLLALSKKKTNNMPLGVYSSKTKTTRYRSHFIHNSKRIHIGSYKSREDAFNDYSSFKEKLIKQEAEKLYNDGKISDKIYNKIIELKLHC